MPTKLSFKPSTQRLGTALRDNGRQRILTFNADNRLIGYFERRQDSKGCPFDIPAGVNPLWGQWPQILSTNEEELYQRFAWTFGVTDNIDFVITNDAWRALLAETNPSLAVCHKCLSLPSAKCRYFNDFIPWVFAFRDERGDKPITEWRLTFTSWRRRCDKYLTERTDHNDGQQQ